MLNQLSDFATTTLLQQDGKPVSYTFTGSGNVICPTLFRGPEKTATVQSGNGALIDIRFTDFIGLASYFTGHPTRGDKITCEDGQVYEVRPLGTEPPYKLTFGQIRIHTQKVG